MQGSSATTSQVRTSDERKGEWLAFLNALNFSGGDLEIVAWFIDQAHAVNTTLSIDLIEAYMTSAAITTGSMLGNDQARTSAVMLSLYEWVNTEGSEGAPYRSNIRRVIEKLQEEFVPALKIDKWADFSLAAGGTGRKLGHSFRKFFFPEWASHVTPDERTGLLLPEDVGRSESEERQPSYSGDKAADDFSFYLKGSGQSQARSFGSGPSVQSSSPGQYTAEEPENTDTYIGKGKGRADDTVTSAQSQSRSDSYAEGMGKVRESDGVEANDSVKQDDISTMAESPQSVNNAVQEYISGSRAASVTGSGPGVPDKDSSIGNTTAQTSPVDEG